MRIDGPVALVRCSPTFTLGKSFDTLTATLADTLGDQAAVSKSTVSAICRAIKDEYESPTHIRACPLPGIDARNSTRVEFNVR